MLNVEYPNYMFYSLLLGVVSLQMISTIILQLEYNGNEVNSVIDMGTKSIETWLAGCLWDVFTDT